MSQVSTAQVEEAVRALKDAQASLPAAGSFSKKADMLVSIIDILRECWNTTSGKSEQERLQQIVNSDLNIKEIEEKIEVAKSKDISYTQRTEEEVFLSSDYKDMILR